METASRKAGHVILSLEEKKVLKSRGLRDLTNHHAQTLASREGVHISSPVKVGNHLDLSGKNVFVSRCQEGYLKTPRPFTLLGGTSRSITKRLSHVETCIFRIG